MNPQEFLLYAVTFTTTWKYVLLFFGIVVEGPILMVVAGFLLHSAAFDLVPLFIVILAADLCGDMAWYAVGYHFAEPRLRKNGKFFGVTVEKFDKVKALFDKYHEKILFISKITIGFGLALGTLIVAGATKMPFKRFMLLNFLGEFVLVAALLTLGYLFGQLYDSIAKDFKILALVGAVGLALLIGYAFVNFVKDKIK